MQPAWLAYDGNFVFFKRRLPSRARAHILIMQIFDYNLSPIARGELNV